MIGLVKVEVNKVSPDKTVNSQIFTQSLFRHAKPRPTIYFGGVCLPSFPFPSPSPLKLQPQIRPSYPANGLGGVPLASPAEQNICSWAHGLPQISFSGVGKLKGLGNGRRYVLKIMHKYFVYYDNIYSTKNTLQHSRGGQVRMPVCVPVVGLKIRQSVL